MRIEHESPFQLAQRIRRTLPSYRGRQFFHQPDTTAAYLRMTTACLPEMIDQLEEAAAPMHVVRWCAWGRDLPERILRVALALYVRRRLDPRAPGRSATGVRWLKDAEQNVAQAIFLESTEGEPTMAWIRASYLAPEYQGRDGHAPEFWAELERRVRSIPLEDFWAEVERRVAAKPKRRGPRGSRAGRVRAPALTAEQRGALRVVKKLLADHGLLDEADATVRRRGRKRGA